MKNQYAFEIKNAKVGVPCETWYNIFSHLVDGNPYWWISSNMLLNIMSKNKPRDYPEVGIKWVEVEPWYFCNDDGEIVIA